MDAKAAVADALCGARRRTLDLLAPLDDSDLRRQHSPLMSPLVWDLAHVGNYEEQWLVRAVSGRGPLDSSLDDLYDAFRHPRPNRPSLPLLGPQQARDYLHEVRERALDVLDGLDFESDPRPLVGGGFVFGMVLQHEHQHDETMLATLQLMPGPGYQPVEPGRAPDVTERPLAAGEVYVAGGSYLIGTDTDPWAYDNERGAHSVDLAPFYLDTYPVTNGEFTEFIAAGGYDDRRWWSTDGWAWRQAENATSPLFWTRQGGQSWSRVRFGHHEDVPFYEPVQHVSWYEADAYARWAGRRLPTEAEWEVAAGGRRYPWGDDAPTADRANLGSRAVSDARRRRFGPSSVGSYPAGAAPSGVQQMIGDVWEWTSSDFEPYPGFVSFPYREYSGAFFGPGYKVLRGGSWATHPSAVRNTFRNWDYPVRRQIFAGFRCARSA